MAMIDRDWLYGLIDQQGFTVNMCADPSCHEEHEVLEISGIEQAILTAKSHHHSWVGPIWFCDACGPCESEPCGLGNCSSTAKEASTDSDLIYRKAAIGAARGALFFDVDFDPVAEAISALPAVNASVAPEIAKEGS